MYWNVQGKYWIRFDKNNKRIHLKSNCCFENTSDFLSCSRLYLYFQDFFQVWKSNFQYFFKNSGLYTNPEQSSPIKYRYGLMKIT